jgi:hypothetical protein
VAAERGEELGDSVGFGVRFEGVTPRPYGMSSFFCLINSKIIKNK